MNERNLKHREHRNESERSHKCSVEQLKLKSLSLYVNKTIHHILHTLFALMNKVTEV